MKKPFEESLKRVWVMNGRIIVNGEAVGDRFEDSREAHVVRHWLTKNFPSLVGAVRRGNLRDDRMSESLEGGTKPA